MSEDRDTGPSPLDQLALDLRARRREAGEPSYAEIMVRIGRDREAAGTPGSRPGRTTVYDAFRTGRRRIDTELVVEIVRALGADEAEAAAWAARCRSARQAPPAAPERAVVAPEPQPARPLPPAWLILVLCLVGNLAGRGLVNLLDLPLHLDMVGTVVSAVLLGPWWGAAVGLGTNVAGSAISGPESLPFAAVNVAGALVWGYGARFGWARSAGRFLVLSLGAGLACTLVATPIVLLLFGGYADHAEDALTRTILEMGPPLGLAVLGSNLLTSLADKVVTGFVGLAVAEGVRGRDQG